MCGNRDFTTERGIANVLRGKTDNHIFLVFYFYCSLKFIETTNLTISLYIA